MSKNGITQQLLVSHYTLLTACTVIWAGNRHHANTNQVFGILSGLSSGDIFSMQFNAPPLVFPIMAKVILLKKRASHEFILQPQNEKLGPGRDLYFSQHQIGPPGVKQRH